MSNMLHPRVIKHNDIHYAIQGSVYKVNFYPTTKTFYINGANKINNAVCSYTNVNYLIKIADGLINLPNVSYEKTTRKKSYKIHKQRIFEKGVKSCYWCKKDLTTDTATLEHKIPLSKGGSNRPDNLTVCCFTCNNTRKNSLTKPIINQ